MPNLDITHWSIARRISAITFGLTAVMVLLACVGLFSTFRIAGVFGPYSAASNDAVNAAGITGDLLKAHLAAMTFRDDPSEENGDRYRRHVARVREEGQRLSKRVAGNPISEEAVTSILATLDEYEEAFGALRRMRGKADALVADIAASTPEIRAQLDGAQTVATFGGNARVLAPLELAIKQFDLSSILSERFLLTNEAEDFRKSDEHFEKAKRSLDAARTNSEGDREKENLGNILQAMADFGAKKKEVFEVIGERNRVRDLMIAALEDMDRSALVVGEATRTDRARLSAQGERIKGIVSVLLITISVLSVIAGLLASRKIRHSTRDAVAKSIAEMRGLADGNLEIEIGGTELENEFGDIARSLVVFRDTARERIAIEERQREAEADAQNRKAREAQRAAAEKAALAQDAEANRQAMLRELSRSIGAVVEAGARGDFSGRIEARFDAPELTQMAEAINRLVASVDAGVGETSRVIGRLSCGDLSARMTGDFEGAFKTLRDDVNKTFETLGSMVGQLGGQCDEVGASAEFMLQQADALSKRAEQQAASLEQTSAAVEQISCAANSNAEASARSARIAEDATVRVDSAGTVVSSAVEAMGGIKASSARISEIISVIEGIAFQTNLLALNASVEAARAGSAGKGFAVVAGEVRGLAQRSGEASKSIKALIDEGADEVEKGVALVEQAGRSLREIMEDVAKMADSMGSLTVTAREQAISIAEVSSAITQMDAITQKNAALAEEGRNNSAEMGRKSRAMRELVAWFDTGNVGDRGSGDMAA